MQFCRYGGLPMIHHSLAVQTCLPAYQCMCPLAGPGLTLPAHHASQAKYKEALRLAASSHPPADDFAAALFNCAECLQEGADATVAACAALPDGQLTPAAVQAADAQAAALLEESVSTFRRVLENGQPRVDALVCCGNALRWWQEQGRVWRRWVPATGRRCCRKARSIGRCLKLWVQP